MKSTEEKQNLLIRYLHFLEEWKTVEMGDINDFELIEESLKKELKETFLEEE